MSDVMVKARVNPTLKDETDKILSELGISTSSAIRMFLAQVKLHRGLPFAVELPDDNDDLLQTPQARQNALGSVHDNETR